MKFGRGGGSMPDERNKFPRREERVVYGNKNNKGRHEIEERPKTRRERPPIRTERAGKGHPKKTRNINKIPQNYKIIGILVAVVLLVLFFLMRKDGVEVLIGEERLGVLEGTSITAEALVETLEIQLEGIVGTKVKINETIVVEKIHIGGKNKKDVSTMEYLLPKIRNIITYQINGANIIVDGSTIATLATVEEAEGVLKTIQSPYTPTEGVETEITFLETVTIEESFVDSNQMVSAENAVTALQTSSIITGTHTIKEGDVLFNLAIEYETSVNGILELNEGMTIEDGTFLGQIINVPISKPKVSVKSIETQVFTTIEPKVIEYTTDNTQKKNYQKVIQQGRAGQKESTIQTTRINGFVIEEKEISKNVIVEPIPEIIATGTR